MRLYGMLLIATLVVGCGGKQQGAAGAGDPRLDGAYTLVQEETRGLVRKETEPNVTFTFAGDRLMRGKQEAGVITCDPNKTPAEITIAKTEMNGKVDHMYGIYKLEGNTLTLCLMRSDNPAERPKTFAAGKDSTAILWVLQKTP